MINGTVRTLMALLTIVCLFSSANSNLDRLAVDAWSAEENKVILDTDMAAAGDDTLALYLLTQADALQRIELLGVTTTGGNVFTAEATANALRQLELVDRADIPVAQGEAQPLGGFRNLAEESRLYGAPAYCGAYWDEAAGDFFDLALVPEDYTQLNAEPALGYAGTAASEQAAADFIIEKIHAYPGQVTLLCAGPATNVAAALQKDPSIAAEAAGIIYMGGDIDIPGSATAAAEFNWYYDPEAIRICLAADWKVQLVVPDDLGSQVKLSGAMFDKLGRRASSPAAKLALSQEAALRDTPAWDLLAAIIYLNPDLVTDVETRYLTVDDAPGIDSGRAVSWKENAPEGVRQVSIVTGLDVDAMWEYYVNLMAWKQPGT